MRENLREEHWIVRMKVVLMQKIILIKQNMPGNINSVRVNFKTYLLSRECNLKIQKEKCEVEIFGYYMA